MTSKVLLILSTLALVAIASDLKEEKAKKPKYISLFNVVTFHNEHCTSVGSTERAGTCYTTQECESKGGAAMGKCAAGFGVCCVFSLTSGTTGENCSYLTNEGFPTGRTETSMVQYTIRKCNNDVCYLRLDFESFSILGTVGSNENDVEVAGPPIIPPQHPCQDTFDVTSSGGHRIPTICGTNDQMHMFVDIGHAEGNTAMINFNFDGADDTTSRRWEIKVTQYECGDDHAPQGGCLQYFTAIRGRIMTYNYNGDASQTHLRNQHYTNCIRPAEGFCCVRYQLCHDADRATAAPLQSEAFSLDTNLVTAGQDSLCLTRDYITIPSSNSECSQSNEIYHFQKYCGAFFSADTGAIFDNAVCSCQAPFFVGITTDSVPDGGTGVPNTLPNKGLCLDYEQIPCSSVH